MEINQEKLTKSIIRHKRLAVSFDKTHDAGLIVPYCNIGEEVAMVVAEFKCQRCGNERNIQFHHLITRYDEHYINSPFRYILQRHYWANVIILCNDCHNYRHKQNKSRDPNKSGSIKQEYINKIKLRYTKQNEQKETKQE